MAQLGFFEAMKRLASLLKKGDPLEAIGALVPWEGFRADIETVVLTPEEAKKSQASRKLFDAIVLFRMLVLQALSDEQIEYQVCDRATFMRFVGLGSEGGISAARPCGCVAGRALREWVVRCIRVGRNCRRLPHRRPESLLPVPKQRKTPRENEGVKRAETPAEWER